MANFKDAFEFTMRHEDSHPSGKVTSDAGGRTRFGVAERFHPGLTEEFFSGPAEEAQERAEEIYQQEYWRPMRLDEMVDQSVANKLLDMAVNMGVRQAAMYAQRAANALEANQADPSAADGCTDTPRRWPVERLVEDGIVGEQTLAAINSQRPVVYYQMLCEFSAAHYCHVAATNPEQACNLTGWLKRAAA